MKRYCEEFIKKDLRKKMVFFGGPRQVGKNTLSRGNNCSLRYIRDKEGREVDFVTIIDGKVVDLIEVKATDNTISTSLKYYKKLLKPERTVQIVGDLRRPFDQEDISVTNPINFFKNPPWQIKSIP